MAERTPGFDFMGEISDSKKPKSDYRPKEILKTDKKTDDSSTVVSIEYDELVNQQADFFGQENLERMVETPEGLIYLGLGKSNISADEEEAVHIGYWETEFADRVKPLAGEIARKYGLNLNEETLNVEIRYYELNM